MKKELGQESPATSATPSAEAKESPAPPATPSADGGAEPAGASALPMGGWGAGGQGKEGRRDAVQLNEGVKGGSEGKRGEVGGSGEHGGKDGDL